MGMWNHTTKVHSLRMVTVSGIVYIVFVSHRESQLEHKKWELKQVEKSRNVKLTAGEWNDHPDKCLLEMASHRQTYSQLGNA